jgi:hypothetical protein
MNRDDVIDMMARLPETTLNNILSLSHGAASRALSQRYSGSHCSIVLRTRTGAYESASFFGHFLQNLRLLPCSRDRLHQVDNSDWFRMLLHPFMLFAAPFTHRHRGFLPTRSWIRFIAGNVSILLGLDYPMNRAYVKLSVLNVAMTVDADINWSNRDVNFAEQPFRLHKRWYSDWIQSGVTGGISIFMLPFNHPNVIPSAFPPDNRRFRYRYRGPARLGYFEIPPH